MSRGRKRVLGGHTTGAAKALWVTAKTTFCIWTGPSPFVREKAGAQGEKGSGRPGVAPSKHKIGGEHAPPLIILQARLIPWLFCLLLQWLKSGKSVIFGGRTFTLIQISFAALGGLEEVWG